MNVNMNIKEKQEAGFTLLELLIVVSVIAILSVALVLVLNPAETLKKSRDAQRISDLSTIKTALGIYLTSTSTPVMGVCSATKSSTTTPAFLTDGATTNWIDVNLNSLTGGSPISNLPRDPVNSGEFAYLYKCNNTAKTFEVSALLESTTYGPGGTDDKGAKDGGTTSDTRYEVGTDLSL